jgi:hypothetical protein
MKRVYEWITRANQVLLFFVIIGGTALVLFLIYQSTRRYETPHVSVAHNAEEAKQSVVQDVVFLGESSGVYVLGIVKRMVVPSKEPWLRPSVAHLGSGDGSGGQTVNVVFSRGEQRIRTLLEKDGLVLSHNMYTDPRQKEIKALFFSCTTEDTDGNHRLDEKDRNDLYVVAAGLERPDIVVKGVSEFRVLARNHVVVKTGEGDGARFWDIDTDVQSQKEILWK